jgi:hypothetical protein
MTHTTRTTEDPWSRMARRWDSRSCDAGDWRLLLLFETSTCQLGPLAAGGDRAFSTSMRQPGPRPDDELTRRRPASGS